MERHRLLPIFLVAPTSPDERLESHRQSSQGFVYAISRTGITGAQQELAGDARTLCRRLRSFTSLPLAVGFGISRPEHVAAVGAFADAAVVGSAVVSCIEGAAPGEAPARVSHLIQGLRPSVALATGEAAGRAFLTACCALG